MKKYFNVIFGLLLMAAAVYGVISWWYGELWVLVKGFIGPVIFLIGLVFVIIGFSEFGK